MIKANKQHNYIPLCDSPAWDTWAPREEISPRFSKVSVNKETCLRIETNGAFHTYGSWRCEFTGIAAGETYRLAVDYLAEHVEKEQVSVSMLATWMREDGHWIQRGYIDNVLRLDDGWTELSDVVLAPAGTHKVSIELELRWTEKGSVTWRTPRLHQAVAEPKRMVKVATTYYRPKRGTSDAMEINIENILKRIDIAGKQQADLVVISETMCSRNTDPSDLFSDPPQPIPGGSLPTKIAESAKRNNMYVVFNMDELDGEFVYNTSVLFGRNGEMIGKYRKVHLPLAEAQLGLTPGDDYPVFDTDFGRIGLLICWDQTFPEVARAMRLKGAEMIINSTAGDSREMTISRAIENGMYHVIAGTNGEFPSRIINPVGEIICEFGAERADGVGCAEIDLNEKFYDYWMSVGPADGEMRSLYIKERRPDTYDELCD